MPPAWWVHPLLWLGGTAFALGLAWWLMRQPEDADPKDEP